jgi:biopolymer transport protein ExbD
MNAWLVRKEGAPAAIAYPSKDAVVNAMHEGQFAPTDEVKGPDDAAFVHIENHPALQEVASEMDFRKADEKDETHLDMNPLIDVCLVLLIFFILTITYESLKRALDMPDVPTKDEKPKENVKYENIRDQVVVVQAKMAGDRPVIKVDGKETPYDNLSDEIRKAYLGKKLSGKKELVLDVEGAVPWGIQTGIMDAAKGNQVDNIIYPPPKRK